MVIATRLPDHYTPRGRKTPHEIAEQLAEALQRVSMFSIPVMTRDRFITTKQQAQLARELFRSLGLKGIGVKVPRYSMACVVEIRLPRLEVHCPDMQPHAPPGHRQTLKTCPTCHQNSLMRQQVGTILLLAFPNHDDRSNSTVDYYDYCWSIQ